MLARCNGGDFMDGWMDGLHVAAAWEWRLLINGCYGWMDTFGV